MSAGAVEKTEKAYAAVQREVLKLRRAGFLPYEWIADGTRWQIKQPSWDSAKDALNDAAASYRRGIWHNQNVYVEVWSEKDAIASIVSPTTDKWDVPLMIARGFASESFLWSTASTIRGQRKPAVIYQLGDHDPSGVAAWQHVQTKLREFAPNINILFERWRSLRDRSMSMAYRLGQPRSQTAGPKRSSASPSRSTPSRPGSCGTSSMTRSRRGSIRNNSASPGR